MLSEEDCSRLELTATLELLVEEETDDSLEVAGVEEETAQLEASLPASPPEPPQADNIRQSSNQITRMRIGGLHREGHRVPLSLVARNRRYCDPVMILTCL